MSYTLNCSILLTELPLLQRAEAARQAGFDSVEFWWPFAEAVPGDRQVDEFIASLKNAGVKLDGLNFFAGNMPEGDRGLVSWKGRSSEFTDNVAVVAAIGEATGCTSFNALYGNRLADYTPEEQDELGLENLVVAAEGVAGIGGTVLIEPVSGTEAYPLKTAADALAIVDAVKAEGQGNIALLADFYHLAVNGDDVAAVIEDHAKDFGHIQIADAPGRGAPGTGNLPLFDWISRSRELGYIGKVALEYKQDQATAFEWLKTASASA
ncbi:TIM barrel protein [Glutamicibacter sp. JL.03c]|uniref:hydroxypyruvate isomerase family protein n=1 Tax=Glutamicibacter sp. JL.03c TaxID=2984842 RepID=UPI0021F75811|nr:TIM barrel protein [Glutamicibacter sp. JL.03c]UYQ77377.1 TIM barrel protein [Glutamicibacter sp. JL.03c]